MAELFRKSSLERISNPEQLDRAITITSPISWLALAGVFWIVVAVAVWSVIGTLPSTVTVTGMITDTGNSITVFSDYSGTVIRMNKHLGDKVTANEAVATVRRVDGKEQEITAAAGGTVTAMLTAENEPVFIGSELLKITPDIEDEHIYICYVPASEAVGIKKNMKASLYLMSSDSSKYGYVEAKVYDVGSYPVNVQNMSYQLGTENLLSDQFLSYGPVVAVICKIEKDPSSKSGFKWSNDKGKNKLLPNGTFMSAKIVTEEVPPISKLINVFKEKSEG